MTIGYALCDKYFTPITFVNTNPAVYPPASTPCLDDTLIVLQLGQSMNAQYSNHSYPLTHSDHQFNFTQDGVLRHWVEPVFGPSGGGALAGSWFGQFGDRIIDGGCGYTDVIQATIGIGGTFASQWGPTGTYHRVLTSMCVRMKEAGIIPDYIGCGQGVTECFQDLDGSAWLPHWQANIEITRNIFDRKIPWFFELQTFWCAPGNTPKISTPIRAAQAAITSPSNLVFQGPDGDDIGTPYRWDTQHWAQSGNALISQRWADIILAHPF